MACPNVPLFRAQWNAWVLAVSADKDADDLASWMEDLFDELGDTGFHDLDIRVMEDLSDALVELRGQGFDLTTVWRREECDPIPMFPPGTNTRTMLATFVMRGAEANVPFPRPDFAMLSRVIRLGGIEGEIPDVPEEPPGFFERWGERLEKRAKEVTDFYKALAMVAVVVFAFVFARGASQ